MTKPTTEEMLDYMQQAFKYFTFDSAIRDREINEAIRALIEKVGEWEKKMEEWRDRAATLVNDEPVDDFLGRIEARIILLEEIRDFKLDGEEGK